MSHNVRNEVICTQIIMWVRLVTVYLFMQIILHNGAWKQKLQNIHHKTLRKAGLGYELGKVGPLCRKSSPRQNLNNMYCAIFFCHLAAGVWGELTGEDVGPEVIFAVVAGVWVELTGEDVGPEVIFAVVAGVWVELTGEDVGPEVIFAAGCKRL